MKPAKLRSWIWQAKAGYALDDNNASLITDEMKAAVEDAKAKIVSGEIKVHNYMSDETCPALTF